MATNFAWRTFAVLFACVMCAIAATAQARNAPYGTVPLVRLSSNRPAVKVVINERGPFVFVVDTGTTNTIVTPALLATLKLPMLPGPPVDVVSAAGSVRSHYYRVAEIGLPGVIVEGGRAVMMDLPEERGVAGVLGAEFLSNFKIDLNMAARHMVLYAEHAPIHAPNFHRVQGKLNEQGIIVVPGQVERTRVAAAFDSGGRHTIGNTWLAAATGHYDTAKVRNYESRVRDIASQRYSGVTEDFARIVVGPAIWYDRSVLISDIRVFDQIGHKKTPILFIGMDLMNQRRIIIDYAGESLWLSR